MRALLLIAHPNADSFTHAAAAAARAGLERGGHDVDVIDLYAVGFRTAMGADEVAARRGASPTDPMVADHVERLRSADVLVVAYPTWWAGPPAKLKGWLDRVVAAAPEPPSIRRIVGVAMYGNKRPLIALINDGGRRMFTRSLRAALGWHRTTTTWLAMYGMQWAADEDRTRFLATVESKLAVLR